jgi:serine/threonine protein kinase/tetratricopeptide (TPR) repeat protein
LVIDSGKHLGRYEIRSKIGAGGMGEVYLARDLKLNRTVALKFLPAEVAADEKRMQRFIQEARTASALNHPNIVTVFEIDDDNNPPYIASEFIDGETLRERLSRERVSVNETIDFAIQIASALVAAHEAGIVHRDIKPENVMIRRDGIVKVLDFGIAKVVDGPLRVVDREAPTRLGIHTQPGMIIGTAAYMSPEQARGLPVDARTDIFSLGVLIYEAVAGRVPFGGSNVNEILVAVLGDEEAFPLARYAGEVPVELERIVAKLLRKDRDERYQTSKDVLVDLRRLKDDLTFERKRKLLTVSEPREARSEETSTQIARPTSSRVAFITANKKTAVVFILAVLVVLSAVAAYSYLGGSRRAAINSVAVLPFVNVNKDESSEYLCDGISESLTNDLSQLPQLKVISRTSTFVYKDKNVDLQDVARTLGVQAVVTGRVMQRGDDLQISVELVRASDRTEMWGEQYTRKASDLQAVQSDIARSISQKLRLRLSGTEEQRLTKPATANAQAYQLYLTGLFYFRKGGVENYKKALDYYNQAVSLDPDFALAYAMMTAPYVDLYVLTASGDLTPTQALAKSRAAAQKALELDDNLAEAHIAMASINELQWNWTGAEAESKRAIELNPNISLAHNIYALLLIVLGRNEEALAENKRAQELDPLRVALKSNQAKALLFARRYDEAIQVAQAAIKLDPTFPNAHWCLAEIYAITGNYKESVNEYQKTIDLDGPLPTHLCFLGYAYGLAGRRSDALAVLQKLKTTDKYVSPTELAVLYIGLGDKEAALQSLERAYAERDPRLDELKVEPYFDSLRSDPRYQELLTNMHFPR